jgi:hypothetical protein
VNDRLICGTSTTRPVTQVHFHRIFSLYSGGCRIALNRRRVFENSLKLTINKFPPFKPAMLNELCGRVWSTITCLVTLFFHSNAILHCFRILILDKNCC